MSELSVLPETPFAPPCSADWAHEHPVWPSPFVDALADVYEEVPTADVTVAIAVCMLRSPSPTWQGAIADQRPMRRLKVATAVRGG